MAGYWDFTPQPLEGDSLSKVTKSLTNAGGLRSQELYGTGTKNVGQATDFWGRLLSGNRAAMLEALAPEVKTIQGQYANLAKANQMFAPRGGGRAAQAAETPYNMAAAIQTLLQKVRPGAADAMSQTGLNQLGLSNQALATVLQAIMQARGYNLQERAQNIGLGTSLGQMALTAGGIGGYGRR